MKEELVLQKSKHDRTCLFNQKMMDNYLADKENAGVSSSALMKYKAVLAKLLKWMQGDEYLTAQKLCRWRKEIEDYGYSKNTVQSYVKVVNDFLRTRGYKELCIPRPMRNNLCGKQFGYLTVTASTGKRHRRDVVWQCSCRCGRTAEVPTNMLLGGHTTSCGCLNVEILQNANRYVEGTSLRQALENKPISKRAVSGFTGVTPKHGKWQAIITYKGVRYYLGIYDDIEDAVKARAKAKEWVMEDASRLYEETKHLYIDQHRAYSPERGRNE